MPFNLSESLVIAAEQELGASLPISYRRSMLQSNGGELEMEVDSWEQYPIADTSDRKRLARTANHILKETQLCRDWKGFPGAALAIAHNGAGDRLVFLKRGAVFEPSVYVWSHETGVLEKVANDFAELTAL